MFIKLSLFAAALFLIAQREAAKATKDLSKEELAKALNPQDGLPSLTVKIFANVLEKAFWLSVIVFFFQGIINLIAS